MAATLSRSTVPYRFPARNHDCDQSFEKRRQTGRMTPSRTVGDLVWGGQRPHSPTHATARCRFSPVIVEKNMRQRSGSVARLLTVVILLASWVVTGHAQTQG